MQKSCLLVLILLLIQVARGVENILHYVNDEVAAGSYKYYSLTYDWQDSVIKVQLISDSGDADLYVSQFTNKPTYDPETNCLQSNTCGEDLVFIPRSFKRPVTIGIYGHPFYESSKYTLLVYRVIPANIDDNYYYSSEDGDERAKNKDRRRSFGFKFYKTAFVITALEFCEFLFQFLF